MASTNKTANYNLSQYVGTDKPTYLGDYNSDMSKIDAQMKTNSEATSVVAGQIETVSSTANTALQNANTAQSTADSAESTATNALEKATTNEASITSVSSDLSNLKTYVSEETVIGTFNGKPLYRKTIIKNHTSGLTDEVDIDTTNDGNYYDYMCISDKSIIKLTTSPVIKFQPINFISGSSTSSYYVRANIQYSNKWYLYLTASELASIVGTIYLVVEYTKTND